MTQTNYHKMNIMTASPMELILMLYDECIRALAKADQAFSISGPERIESINNHLLHAQDIITELAVSLDLEKGGEIAGNLQRLYDFMVHHLSQANVAKDRMKILEVRKMMEDLREAWQDVSKQETSVPSAAAPSSPMSTINISG